MKKKDYRVTQISCAQSIKRLDKIEKALEKVILMIDDLKWEYR